MTNDNQFPQPNAQQPDAAPQYYQPAQQHPGNYEQAPLQQPQLTPTRPTNVLAVVGFVLSFFVTLVGAIVSLVALSQIKKSGEKGYGLAVAGAIIGFVGTVAYIIYFVIILGALGGAFMQLAADNDPIDSYHADSYSSSAELGSDSTMTPDEQKYCLAIEDLGQQVSTVDADPSLLVQGLEKIAQLSTDSEIKNSISAALPLLSQATNEVSPESALQLTELVQLLQSDYLEKCFN